MRLGKNKLFEVFNMLLIDYPVPTNLNFFWNFGILAGLTLVVQLLTGIFCAMHYTPHVDLAFNSVEHIMRDVNNGWLIRYMHANGASMFFITVYAHMFRGLYYGSYMAPRQPVWGVGVIIYILMMATAFLGYVLPWGQMSLWGATVITNLFSTIPFLGDDIVAWLWGGFSVNNATLNRFFSLHYLLPFVIAAFSGIHIIVLHQYGANNPLGISSKTDLTPFYPYYYTKDLFAVVLYFILFATLVFFYPNLLGHPDNYLVANPMVTPPHIVPEWYFLPMYAILRSIPNKVGGVIAMGAAIVVLLFLPFLNISKVRNNNYRPLFSFFFWLFVLDCLILGWIGGKPVETPFIECGQIATVYYFAFFFVIIPAIGYLDNWAASVQHKYATQHSGNKIYL
jgi:ubiquinol-cytochrome c reductase cytochrome b subunit